MCINCIVKNPENPDYFGTLYCYLTQVDKNVQTFMIGIFSFIH